MAIRTLTITGQSGELGVGGGVVYDSESFREFEECMLKARYYEAARTPLRIIETLFWSPEEGFVRIEKHLARMARSANFFGVPFGRAQMLRRMEESVEHGYGPLRVRATLADTGEIGVSSLFRGR